MKIGIVCPYNIFKPGGVQQHVAHQARLLKKRGHQVTILTPRPYRVTDSPPEGTCFVGASARVKAPHATSADVSVADDMDILEILNNLQLDLIHVHEPMVPFVGRSILQKATCPKLGTFHAAMPGNALGKSFTASYKAYGRSVLPHLDAISAVSPAAIGYIKDSNELPINYIPNGIALDEYRRDKKIARSKNSILFVGRLEKRKGCKNLIKAFEILKQTKPDAELLIVGDGPLREGLENYVSGHRIPDVYFLGAVPDDEKKQLLQKAAVFSSPALYGESFGIVLAEAMALGTPIIAHQNPGYEWVLSETGRISLVDCEDAPAYARHLALMMEDEPLRRLWQDWASSYVQQFSYENVVTQYEKLYKDIISK